MTEFVPLRCWGSLSFYRCAVTYDDEICELYGIAQNMVIITASIYLGFSKYNRYFLTLYNSLIWTITSINLVRFEFC